MTEPQARAAADALKHTMNRWGVTCSIELQEGRGVDPWGVYVKYHRMWHHTVSTYRVGGNLTPVLGIVKNGRSDVPGPLANGYIGYDRIFRIICLGEANHPGLGGPIVIDGVRIPKNSARKPTFGIEVEGGLQTWEDIDDLGPDMLEVMGRADNALAEWSGRPLTSQMEHKTWAPERKVDRKDFDADRDRGIALTRKWFELDNPEPVPVPPTAGDDGMFAYDRKHGDTKVLVVVAAGKQTRMIGATVGTNIRGADYYFGLLDKQNVDWVDTNYGPVAGLPV